MSINLERRAGRGNFLELDYRAYKFERVLNLGGFLNLSPANKYLADFH